MMNLLNTIFGNNAPMINNKNNKEENAEVNTSVDNRHSNQGHVQLDSKIWRNPMSLFRGAEYNRLMEKTKNKKEALTFYDMNLSAQDHQTLFTCDGDSNREDLEIMLIAWRERDPEMRIKSAHKAIEKNPDCAPAYILLAEEEATNIHEVERILLIGLKAAEFQYKKSQLKNTINTFYENQHRRDINVLIYIKRRLAMCARKLGKVREAVKMMRDLIKEFPMANLFSIHENLIEALLEINAYVDVQTLLIKYDDINLPKSATICYTSALLKLRNIEKITPDLVLKRGLSMAAMNAIEAIHRAVEFNPHVPKYLLHSKNLILPPEHILKRGDSEAISYVFFHLPHWKRVDGALKLLDCTWQGAFRAIPYPLEKGNLFYPYLTCTECADRELLPDYHELSIYPNKKMPIIIHIFGFICVIIAVVSFLFYQYPLKTILIIQTSTNWAWELFELAFDYLESILPNWASQYINWQ